MPSVLLTAYADTDVAITAINEIGLELLPAQAVGSPGERLYPVIDDLLDDWRTPTRRDSEVRVVGDRGLSAATRCKTFLAGNHVPYAWSTSSAIPKVSPGRLGRRQRADAPPCSSRNRSPLRRPNARTRGDVGLRTQAHSPSTTWCIVGGGPAGLATPSTRRPRGCAPCSSSSQAPGGQAGQSA